MVNMCPTQTLSRLQQDLIVDKQMWREREMVLAIYRASVGENSHKAAGNIRAANIIYVIDIYV